MKKKQITLKHIAKELDVSVSTVSRALQNHPRIGLRTREKVHELVEKLHFTPSLSALRLKQRKTYTIGLVVPNVSEQFFATAISGIEEVAEQGNYAVLLFQTHDLYDKEKKAIEALIRYQVDGIIISLAKETSDLTHLEAVKAGGISLVLFDRVPDGISGHSVRCDIKAGAIDATRYLMDNHYQNIGFLNGPVTLSATQERWQGFSQVMQEHNNLINNDYIKNVDLTAEDVDKKMSELLSLPTPPDAVITFNDYVAMDAIKYCVQSGVRVDEQIVFVSFANLPFCKYLTHPPAASVEQFPYKLGLTSAELLIKSIENETTDEEYAHVVIKPELIVHNSGRRIQAKIQN